ncbi:hypothetical protein WMY93_020409 [Mugilogobius chulae]|uniref:Uncharacterized protein n=1 Tax=Mugilogobius chulae TaxID=88201 RepID=A0AAW0NNV6_9GOBI
MTLEMATESGGLVERGGERSCSFSVRRAGGDEGEAWRIMGTEQDPKGHEFPYNPRADDYAVPKRVQRAFPDPELEEALERDQDQSQGPSQDPDQQGQEPDQEEEEPELEGEEPEEEEESGEEMRDKDSPYKNLPMKTEEQQEF